MNNSTLSALAVSGGTLYAGGSFTAAGGNAANYIAQWNGTNWSAIGSGMNNSVSALAVCGGTLYAGGGFTAAGGNAAITSPNGTERLVSDWFGRQQAFYYPFVSALAVSGSTLYAAAPSRQQEPTQPPTRRRPRRRWPAATNYRVTLTARRPIAEV